MATIPPSKKQGFTLVELIVVLVILAIIAAFSIPALLGYIEDAQETRDQVLVCTVIRNLETAIHTEDCYNEFMTDVAQNGSASHPEYDQDIAIVLSDGPNYAGRGYSVWHLYDAEGNEKTSANSAIMAKIKTIIDPDDIHFYASSHAKMGYMIKIYMKNDTLVVSPYTDEAYTYTYTSGNDLDALGFYQGGWTTRYYNIYNH